MSSIADFRYRQVWITKKAHNILKNKSFIHKMTMKNVVDTLCDFYVHHKDPPPFPLGGYRIVEKRCCGVALSVQAYATLSSLIKDNSYGLSLGTMLEHCIFSCGEAAFTQKEMTVSAKHRSVSVSIDTYRFLREKAFYDGHTITGIVNDLIRMATARMATLTPAMQSLPKREPHGTASECTTICVSPEAREWLREQAFHCETSVKCLTDFLVSLVNTVLQPSSQEKTQ